jgi:hypothetical protein
MDPKRLVSSRLATWAACAVAALTPLLLAGGAALAPESARAVPSFARQTGLECTSCHTAFPQLTPFGRYFKLHGYVESSGQTHLPPLAVMVQAPTFTRTDHEQTGGAAPHFDNNDNVALNQLSFFYNGRLFGPYAEDLFGKRAGDLLNHVGTFIQGTYDGVGREWAWDNSEIRAAASTELGGQDLVLGVYANNNPTMQDLWNTTPAWGFPFSGSGLAPGPMAAPLIAGGLEQQVAGFGGYAMLADSLYTEMGAYTTLPAHAQRSLGVDPTGEAEIDDFAPYWRVAFEHAWGDQSLEIGSYGLHADTLPARIQQAGHDHITDVGFDSQYQYLTPRHDVTLLFDFLHEWADWNASQPLGLAGNANDHLWSLTATGSYLFDETYGADVQYFRTDGDKDGMLYGTRTGSPKTSGFVFQLDWIPFAKSGGPWFWPKMNVKLSAQYVLYRQFDGAHSNFDGTGRDASDNNTLYLQTWLAF